MVGSRSWMYNNYLPQGGGLTDEFCVGLQMFMAFARSQVHCMDGSKMKCPCRKCHNQKFQEPDIVEGHLCRFGFTPNYYNWISHGEELMSYEEYLSTHDQFLPREECSLDPPLMPYQSHDQFLPGEECSLDPQLNPYQRMVIDAASHNFGWEANNPSTYDQGSSSHTLEMGNQYDTTTFDENLCNQFREVLRSADEPLYAGCENYTQLSITAQMLSAKADHNVSDNCFNTFTRIMHDALPRDNIMPSNFSEMKNLVHGLGLPVQRIDVCTGGCMLYWKDDADADSCKFCGKDRYKPTRRRGHRRSVKQLFYLPLIPRLQRLYASPATAEHMTWHADHETEEDIMSHPSDAYAWKHFNRTYPEFAKEPRNIRLGLCADGFAPFGKSGRNYSCWPVILTPYNFPPGMCMKTPYMFLTLIVPGPQNPKKRIDVYMQPLIEELQQLWNQGVPTFDVRTEQTFLMRAALMWTINDFPAYGMLSGWSTAGLLGCPICMERSKAFRLNHGRKACYFDCHRMFLPMDHPFRKNRKEFIRKRTEDEPPPLRLTGNQLWARVQPFPSVVDDPDCTTYGYGNQHKWTKRSIFWDLPYWKTHIVHHNLDVMHIEKNVFDNVINTVMDVPTKTKDNLNARKDMRELCHRPTLSVAPDSKGPKPKAVYTLSREQRHALCQWLQSVRFPDGYVSKIGRCIDTNASKLTGMKSHDCHVFMERLLPIATKEFLPSFVWGALTDLSNFFHDICPTVIRTSHMKKLEKAISRKVMIVTSSWSGSFRR